MSTSSPTPGPGPAAVPPARPAAPGPVPRPGVEWEYRTLTIARDTSRAQARQLLTEHAEYGRWELSRVRLYRGGRREVQLRRKVMRVERTV